MNSHARQKRIGNTIIREDIEITLTVESMIESNLRWYGHGYWIRPLEGQLRRVDQTKDGHTSLTIWGNDNVERPSTTKGQNIKRILR